MSVLLVLTVGQTDVQLVEDSQRKELEKNYTAALHDEIERRAGEWRLVGSPTKHESERAAALPQRPFALCTPKLDAVLAWAEQHGTFPTAALVLDTRRENERGDPRYAGAVVAQRLRERGVADVQCVTYLGGRERLEDPHEPRDAVIRRDVVGRIDEAVRNAVTLTNPQQVVVAATGAFPTVVTLVEEIVRLRAADREIDLLDVPDSTKTGQSQDRAVRRTETPEPAVSYQTRRNALALMDHGNLLGAWGAVQHLHGDEVEREWTRVIEWLACFAASLPMPTQCDIPVLTHERMAVRAALRVELALRAGDVPRAVHGTVAFFEAALWDHLAEHATLRDQKHKLYDVQPAPCAKLVREPGCQRDDDTKRPFEAVDKDGIRLYKIHDDMVNAARLAKRYLENEPLHQLAQAVNEVRDLRNDVAHNEPTPPLMEEAHAKMRQAGLWSHDNHFLTQHQVQCVLSGLGIDRPDRLCDDLLAEVRSRLTEWTPWRHPQGPTN